MKFLKLFILIAVIGLSACAKQTFTMSKNNGELRENNISHFFVNGIGQDKTINAAAICGGPENVAMVESHTSFVNVLASQLTFSIYSPKQARVYCEPQFIY